MLAAFYGQPPDTFDGWPNARVEFELLVMRAIREEGEWPLTENGLVVALDRALGGDGG